MHQADLCTNLSTGTYHILCLDESFLFIRKKDDLLHVMEDYNKMCCILSYVLIYLLKDIINNAYYVNTH